MRLDFKNRLLIPMIYKGSRIASLFFMVSCSGWLLAGEFIMRFDGGGQDQISPQQTLHNWAREEGRIWLEPRKKRLGKKRIKKLEKKIQDKTQKARQIMAEQSRQAELNRPTQKRVACPTNYT